MKKNNLYLFIMMMGLILASTACTPKIFKEKWTSYQSPETFKAVFETTKGNFEIEANRSWSPKGVDRLYQLIKSEFYTDMALYRVVPNFVAQFGIHDIPELNKSWKNNILKDEPVIQGNHKGSISFARGGKDSRTTQLFINLKSNSPRLDTIHYSNSTGFPVVAKITKGMDVVLSFYDKYGGDPGKKQGEIQKEGNAYLKKIFPKLDYINKAYIVK